MTVGDNQDVYVAPDLEIAQAHSEKILSQGNNNLTAVLPTFDEAGLIDIKGQVLMSDTVSVEGLIRIQNAIFDAKAEGDDFKLPPNVWYGKAGRNTIPKKIKGKGGTDSDVHLAKIINELRIMGVIVYKSDEGKDTDRFLYHAESGYIGQLGSVKTVTEALSRLVRSELPSIYNNENFIEVAKNAVLICNQLEIDFSGSVFDPKRNDKLIREYIAVNRNNADKGYTYRYNTFDATLSPALDNSADSLITENDRIAGGILFKILDAFALRIAESSALEFETEEERAANVALNLAEIRNVIGNVLRSDKFERLIAAVVLVSPHRGVGKSMLLNLIGGLIGFDEEGGDIEAAITDAYSDERDHICLFKKHDEWVTPAAIIQLFKDWVTNNKMLVNIKFGYKGGAKKWYHLWGASNEIHDVLTSDGFDRRLLIFMLDAIHGVYTVGKTISKTSADGDFTPQVLLSPKELAFVENSADVPYMGWSSWLSTEVEPIEDGNGNTWVTALMLVELMNEENNIHLAKRHAVNLVTAAKWYTGTKKLQFASGRAPSRALEMMTVETNGGEYSAARDVIARIVNGIVGVDDKFNLSEKLSLINRTMTAQLEKLLRLDGMVVQGVSYSLQSVGSEWYMIKDGVEVSDEEIADIKARAIPFNIVGDSNEEILKDNSSGVGAVKKAVKAIVLDRLADAGRTVTLDYVQYNAKVNAIVVEFGLAGDVEFGFVSERAYRKYMSRLDNDLLTTEPCDDGVIIKVVSVR